MVELTPAAVASSSRAHRGDAVPGEGGEGTQVSGQTGHRGVRDVPAGGRFGGHGRSPTPLADPPRRQCGAGAQKRARLRVWAPAYVLVNPCTKSPVHPVRHHTSRCASGVRGGVGSIPQEVDTAEGTSPSQSAARMTSTSKTSSRRSGTTAPVSWPKKLERDRPEEPGPRHERSRRPTPPWCPGRGTPRAEPDPRPPAQGHRGRRHLARGPAEVRSASCSRAASSRVTLVAGTTVSCGAA